MWYKDDQTGWVAYPPEPIVAVANITVEMRGKAQRVGPPGANAPPKLGLLFT